jgi:hypothetical protein
MDTVDAKRTNVKLLAVLSTVLFLATVTVNALANILPINGVGTGALSDELPNLFVPAGLTFAIWGLIYLLLLLYSGAILFGAFKGAKDWGVADGIAFSINLAANSAWIFAWHFRQVGLSLALMLVILGTLIFLAESGAAGRAGGKARKFLLDVPIGVYLGWICVATIANATALLVKLGWNGFGVDPRIWTVLVIAAGLFIGLLFLIRRTVWAPPLVIVWAYAGIVIKRLGADRAYSAPVWIAAAAAALILCVAIAAILVSGRKRPEAAKPARRT